MIKLNISLFAVGTCRVCCIKPAGLFGFCDEHQKSALRTYFRDAVYHGFAEAVTPKCFKSDESYHEYVATFLGASGSELKQPRVDVCRDCNPEYKEQMMKEGRCEHHETVFIRSIRMGGEVIGVAIDSAKKSTSAWENAMMGVSGEVVKLPPHYAIDETLKQIHKDAEPKKRGPKFKKDRE